MTVTGPNSLHCHSWTLFILCCCCLFFFVDPINGGWTDWTVWFPCSVSCGGGVQISIRFCTKPYPSRGGKYCVGPSVKKQICNPQHCPCKYCAVGWLSKYIYPSLTWEQQPNCEEKKWRPWAVTDLEEGLCPSYCKTKLRPHGPNFFFTWRPPLPLI